MAALFDSIQTMLNIQVHSPMYWGVHNVQIIRVYVVMLKGSVLCEFSLDGSSATERNTKFCGLSQRANYNDRATAACRRS
jgi:hypothetical protein